MIKVGGYIGIVQEVKKDGNKTWICTKDKIKSMRFGKTKKTIAVDRFYALNYEEIENNTKMLSENNKIMLIKEPVYLSDGLEDRIDKWIEWANTSGDAKSIFEN